MCPSTRYKPPVARRQVCAFYPGPSPFPHSLKHRGTWKARTLEPTAQNMCCCKPITTPAGCQHLLLHMLTYLSNTQAGSTGSFQSTPRARLCMQAARKRPRTPQSRTRTSTRLYCTACSSTLITFRAPSMRCQAHHPEHLHTHWPSTTERPTLPVAQQGHTLLFLRTPSPSTPAVTC